jgi:hypothetical protein
MWFDLGPALRRASSSWRERGSAEEAIQPVRNSPFDHRGSVETLASTRCGWRNGTTSRAEVAILPRPAVQPASRYRFQTGSKR